MNELFIFVHIQTQGQSKEWLRRLVPLLSSKRTEAQSLAAFHFAMEAGIKLGQGHKEVVRIPIWILVFVISIYILVFFFNFMFYGC